MLNQDLPRAVQAGLLATAVYAIVLHLFEALGYSLVMMWGPAFCYSYWAVFPGAVLLSLAVMALSRRFGGGWHGGALYGAFLAPFNAPFGVLLCLFWWQFEAVLGWAEPWRYGFGCLLDQWVQSFASMLVLGTPVAMVCGAIVGAWLGRGNRQ